jgi:hypothetical protein
MSETQGAEGQAGGSAATIEARIAAHRIAIAHGLVEGQLNILAEGNSWFDYPVGQQTDLLAFLPRQYRPPEPKPVVLSLAHFGDAVADMLGPVQLKRMRRVLQDNSLGTFDVILFSGGGNDLVGRVMADWLNEATGPDDDIARAVNEAAFSDRLGRVEEGYRKLIALRDSLAPGVPIVSHGYDFARPTNTSVCDGTVGPWLYPSLHARRWMHDESEPQILRGAAIVRQALDRFHGMLLGLSQEPGARFHIAGTRDTLATTEWANELHPTPRGAGKLAKRFRTAIDAAVAAPLTS